MFEKFLPALPIIVFLFGMVIVLFVKLLTMRKMNEELTEGNISLINRLKSHYEIHQQGNVISLENETG